MNAGPSAGGGGGGKLVTLYIMGTGKRCRRTPEVGGHVSFALEAE